MASYRLLKKNDAIPIKSFGKYTCWFYKEDFVVTKKTYKKEHKETQNKEKIVCTLEPNGIIDVMKRQSLSTKILRTLEKQAYD